MSSKRKAKKASAFAVELDAEPRTWRDWSELAESLDEHGRRRVMATIARMITQRGQG